MREQLLIIKVGTTFPELAEKRGDFDQWFIESLEVQREGARVVDVTRGEALPNPREIAGAAITGSHAMVTDREEWSELTASWIREAIAVGTPILGVCYGHQLIAHALGGTVADNPAGREVGTRAITLHESAREDRLFAGLPNPLSAQVSHVQAIIALPEEATLLASSEMDAHQAFSVGDSVWGVQFHPEFDCEIMGAYIDGRREPLRAQGLDPDALRASCVETPDAMSIMRRFHALVLPD